VSADSGLLIIRTLTSDGAVLDGCVVSLRPVRAMGRPATDYPALTREPGVHTAASLPAGDYDVWLTVPSAEAPMAFVAWPGFGRVTIDVSVGPRSDLMAGTVLDTIGRPVAGAVVSLSPADQARQSTSLFCTTDVRGRFVFRRADGSSARTSDCMLTDALGRAGIADASEPLRLAWGELTHVMVADRRQEVVVRLCDSDGRPANMLAVEVRCNNGHGEVVRSASDIASGEAHIALVPTGKASVLVVPAGPHPPIQGEVVVKSDGSGSAVFSVQQGNLFEVFVRTPSAIDPSAAMPSLSPRRRLGQGVTESDTPLVRVGVPVPGLRVPGIPDRGRFEFWCDPGTVYELRVAAPGCVPHESEVRAREGVFESQVVELTTGGVLVGRLQPGDVVGWLRRYDQERAEPGTPAIGSILLVKAERSLDGSTERVYADVGESGSFETRGLTRGKWLVRLIGPTRNELLTTAESDGASVTQLGEFDMERLHPGEVWGRVQLQQQGCRVRALFARADGGGSIKVRMRPDETFEFAAPAGSYRLQAEVLDPDSRSVTFLAPQSVVVVAGTRIETILQVALRRLQIRILDDETGKPLDGFRLSIDEERAGGAARTVATDGNGVAVIYPCPLVEFGLSYAARGSSSWVPLARPQGDSVNPLVVRVASRRRGR